MPILDKPKKRPWEPQRPTGQQQGRYIITDFYQSKEWRVTRNHYISHHPLCEECLRNGKTTPAKVVDHIQPINPLNPYDTQNGKYGEPLDDDNLQSLCEHDHAIKSAKEKWTKKY